MSELELPLGEDHKSSPFTKTVALITACFAVLLAIAGMAGSNITKDIMLAQQEISNLWAYYQAKVIREHMYTATSASHKLALLEKGASAPAALRQALATQAAQASEQAARYQKEKKEIAAKARALETRRDQLQIRDPYFDWAQIALQVAIILGSIALIINSGLMFGLGVAFASLGTLLGANGFFLLVRLPFLH